MNRTFNSLLFLFAFPLAAAEPVAFTLNNGLRVRLVPGDSDKDVVLLLGVRAGFLAEPAGVPHLAHVTEHLAVFDLKPKEAAAAGEWFKQGKANGETLADFMYFDLNVPKADLELALRVQALRLAGPDFSKETLAREIPRTLQELEFVEKSPQAGTGKFALGPFTQGAFHAKTESPIKALTKAITVDQAKEFHARTFRADQAILVVAGAFDPATARKIVEAEFGKIEKPMKPPTPRPEIKAGEKAITWDASTRHLMLAWNAPTSQEPDHAALTLVSLGLLQSMFLDAELNKLAKPALATNETEGLFLVNVQLKPDADPAKAKDKLLELVARYGDRDRIKDGDWNLLRSQFGFMAKPVDLTKTSLPAHVSKVMARANMEIQRMMKEIVWGDLDAYAKRVAEAKPEALRAAAAKHLAADKACIVHVVPAEAKK